MNRQGTVNRPADVPESVWTDFLVIRNAKKAPLTQTALAGIEREAVKAGLSLGDALAVCCERGWQAFRADWIPQPSRASPNRRETTEEHNRRAFAEWLGEPTDDARTIDA